MERNHNVIQEINTTTGNVHDSLDSTSLKREREYIGSVNIREHRFIQLESKINYGISV